MSSIAELTAKVEQLQNQVSQLQKHTNAPVEAPVIRDFYHCGTCNTDFPSWNSREQHPCLRGVREAAEKEMERFDQMLADEVNEPQVRRVNFVITPDGFSVPEDEARAIALSELNEKKKRASLAAHDKAIGVKA